MTAKERNAPYADWIVFYPQQEHGRFDHWRVAEKNADGTITIWDYMRFGAIGQTGHFKPEAKIKPITTAKERAEVDRVKRMIARSVERSQMQYDLMKGVST